MESICSFFSQIICLKTSFVILESGPVHPNQRAWSRSFGTVGFHMKLSGTVVDEELVATFAFAGTAGCH